MLSCTDCSWRSRSDCHRHRGGRITRAEVVSLFSAAACLLSFLSHLLLFIFIPFFFLSSFSDLYLDQTGRRLLCHETTFTFHGPPSETSCHSPTMYTHVTTYLLVPLCIGSEPMSSGMTSSLALDLTGTVPVVSRERGGGGGGGIGRGERKEECVTNYM